MEKKFFLEKNAGAIVSFCGKPINKKETVATEEIPNLLRVMADDEEILYAFKAIRIVINNINNAVDNAYAIITNKRFYYTGTNLSSMFARSKVGNVDIADVHAISMSKSWAAVTIKFETKNENYEVTPFSDKADKVIEVLEEVKRLSKETKDTSTPQQVSSADEILKFKSLLDNGIITQEEFDAKKKQLLGL